MGGTSLQQKSGMQHLHHTPALCSLSRAMNPQKRGGSVTPGVDSLLQLPPQLNSVLPYAKAKGHSQLFHKQHKDAAVKRMEVMTGADVQGHVLLQFVWVKFVAHMKSFLPRSRAADYSFAESAFSFTASSSDMPGNHGMHTVETEASYCLTEALPIHAEKEH